MSRIRVNFINSVVNIAVDEQHLSRLTEPEVRDLIAQLLVFGGKELRQSIANWLCNGTVDSIADFISPELAGDSVKEKP